MRNATPSVFQLSSPSACGAIRMLIGFLQGLALYLLADAVANRSGIATIPFLFAPLFMVALFIPLVLIVGLNRHGSARLTLYIGLLCIVLAVLGFHDTWRSTDIEIGGMLLLGMDKARYPSAAANFITGMIVFLSYCLIPTGKASDAWFARYDTYFENSWRLGLQVCLSCLFVGMFFVVLLLGSALFGLLQLDFLKQLLTKLWFTIPAGGLAFALSLHISDVRQDIVQGSRMLILAFLSWLLLLLVFLLGGFLISLPFAGLGLLWETPSATAILLSVGVMQVVFINVVFKGGPEGAEQSPRVLRVGMRISCLMLPVVTTLAAYGLTLRIAQYGLTPHRVFAIASTLVLSCYAIGYAWTAVWNHADTLAPIANVNLVTASVTLLVLFTLMTPLADPARLSVASQVSRLVEGKVTVAVFDYGFLREGSERYGRQALQRLSRKTEP